MHRHHERLSTARHLPEEKEWIAFGEQKRYVPTVKAGSLVSYKIPAEMSLNARTGVAETRIFKDGDVFEVLRVGISVYKAAKPDLEHHAPSDQLTE